MNTPPVEGQAKGWARTSRRLHKEPSRGGSSVGWQGRRGSRTSTKGMLMMMMMMMMIMMKMTVMAMVM
eukprot:8547314-Pyramimonas_sp.AAC.1